MTNLLIKLITSQKADLALSEQIEVLDGNSHIKMQNKELMSNLNRNSEFLSEADSVKVSPIKNVTKVLVFAKHNVFEIESGEENSAVFTLII